MGHPASRKGIRRNRWLTAAACFLVAAAGLPSGAQEGRPAIPSAMRSVSRYLHNTVRPDVGGEGLWMPQVDRQLKGWLPPAPGLAGDLYYVHSTDLKGLFDIRILDGAGRPLKPEVVSHDWYPTHTITKYRTDGIEFTETKMINDHETAAGDLVMRSTGPGEARIFVQVDDLLAGEPDPDATGGEMLARRLEFVPTTHYFRDFVIRKRYRLAASGLRPSGERSLSGEVVLSSGSPVRVMIRMALATDPRAAQERLESVRNAPLDPSDLRSPLSAHIRAFDEWFVRNVPAFSSSDRALEKMYYYRWYLLKKSRVETRRFAPGHPYPRPALYEGLLQTWFPKIIGFPLPLQITEARWLHDKQIAYDQARNALTRDDFFNYLNWTPYALWQLHLVAPDAAFLKQALPAILGFIRLQEARDEDRDWLPSVFGSWITGMEYQPSFFQFTTPRWDHTTSEQFKPGLDALSRDPAVYRQFTPLERVDEAVYYFLNNLAAARVARALGDEATAGEYTQRASQIRDAVNSRMWDQESGFFYDLEPASGEKALESKAVVGFYPYLFGEMQDTERLSLFDHLLDPGKFWTPFPVASASRDCPAFDPQGYWKVGPKASREQPVFYVCSWNGPTWLFSNALAADALGQAARLSRSERLRRSFNELMRSFTRLQFVRGDLSLPCAVEHYNSETGEPVRFLADYFHSFYNDLVIRFLAGIVPRADDLIEVDPLVEGVSEIHISDVLYKSRRISVSIGGPQGFTVGVDGRRVHRSAAPRRVVYDPVRKTTVTPRD